jgi:HPt (histidine-containing phosphotransfer) domain-containing protein
VRRFLPIILLDDCATTGAAMPGENGMPTEKEDALGAKEGIIGISLPGKYPDWAAFKSAGFDPDALWRRIEGDVELLRELIAVFEEESLEMLGKLAAAIQNGDAAGLEKMGHKIKGSVLQFSGFGAAAAALALEQLGRSGTIAGAETALKKLKHEIDILMKSLHAMAGEMSQ